MHIKIIKDPEYEFFQRGEKRRGGRMHLFVPKLILEGAASAEKLMITPARLADLVNELLIMCDFVGGELRPNEERTRRAREGLIQHAPRLLFERVRNEYDRLYEKHVEEGRIEYVPFGETQPLQNITPDEYVIGGVVARQYVERVGICTEKELDRATRKGLVQFYELPRTAFSRLLAYRLDDLHKLKDKEGVREEKVFKPIRYRFE